MGTFFVNHIIIRLLIYVVLVLQTRALEKRGRYKFAEIIVLKDEMSLFQGKQTPLITNTTYNQI